MTLRAVPAMKISLEGIGPDTPQGAQVMSTLQAIGPGGSRFQVQSFAFQNPEGAREMRGVAPGNYELALSQAGAQRQRPLPLGTAKVSGAGEVKVSAASLARTTVAGRLTLEDGGNTGPLTLFLGQPANNQNAICRAAPDGSFNCSEGRGLGANIMPGLYQVRLANSEDLYVKSISAQQARYTGGLLEVREGATVTLIVTVAKGHTELEGTATREGKPVSGAMILLVERAGASGLGVPRDQSDSDGTFTLRDVHPGPYYLIAIDHGRDLEYHNSEAIAPYLNGATKLDVPLAREQRVVVNVQSRLR
jgi:hypothetical protein